MDARKHSPFATVDMAIKDGCLNDLEILLQKGEIPNQEMIDFCVEQQRHQMLELLCKYKFYPTINSINMLLENIRINQ
jgi:hypothetical protein